MRSRAFPFTFLGVFTVALSGCGWLSTSESTQPTNTNPKVAAQNNDRALSAWIEALGQKVTGETSPTKSSPQKAATPVVYVDIAAIARRHPAWQLADSLEQKPQSNLNINFSSPAAPQSPQQPQIPTASIANSGSVSTRIARGTTESSSVAVQNSTQSSAPARRETASLLPPLQNTIEERQQAALSAFLAQTAQWQENEREARAADLRGALEERIAQQVEAAERNLWGTDAPQLPSPEIQLEMTNLRLKLSSKITMTAQERASTEARLRELEAQWRRALQEDETQRRIALERARIEEPRRMRAEGLEQIQSTLNQWQEQDETQRRRARQVQQELLQQDFGLAQFGIVLPSYQRTFTSPSVGTQISYSDAFSNLSETLGTHLSSMQPLRRPEFSKIASVNSLSSTQRKALAGTGGAVKALRQRAFNESMRWVSAIAKEKGWRVVSVKSSRVQDGTPFVLRQLGQS